jgi:hypothetical protein
MTGAHAVLDVVAAQLPVDHFGLMVIRWRRGGRPKTTPIM